MRYDNNRAFAKHVESAGKDHISPVYLLLCKNERETKEALQLLQSAMQEVPVISYTPEGSQLKLFLEELNTLSAFSPKRIVTMRQAEKLSKPALEALITYFKEPNSQVYLMITASSVDKRTAFYKAAEKCGVILDIPEEKPWQREKTVQRWLREKVYKDGKQIEPRAVDVLIQHMGTNQDLLAQELEKLYCYVGERPVITYQDICEISSHVNVEDIWKLGESVFSFNANLAIHVMRGLLEDGAPFLSLLRQLRSQFQTSFQIATLLASGKGRAEVSKQYPYLTPHLLNKKLQTVQTYELHRFKRGILTIDETEWKAKNSSQDHQFLSEVMMIKLATK